MDSHYYKDYYVLERNHWWFLARAAILKNYIQRNIFVDGSTLRILNVGVATGASTEMLQAFGAVTSIEYERTCIEYIRGKVAIDVMEGSILDLKFEDSSFDLVCAFDVIEHVQDDGVAAKELMRVCAPGGSVLITVPALMSLWGEHDLINHHFKRYKKHEVETLFTASNGHSIFSSYFNSILFVPVFLARKMSNLTKRKREGELRSDFEKFKPGILNRVLYYVMKSESIGLSRRISNPVGVSILHHWRKN